MRLDRLFLLMIIVSIFTSSCVYNRGAASSTYVPDDYLTIKGDINVYEKTISGTTLDGSGKVRSTSSTFYKVQKGDNGKKLTLNSKNLKMMLGDYKPALDLVNKYNKRDVAHTIWRTVNMVGLVGGFVMVGIGAVKGNKGDTHGALIALDGFGVLLVDGLSFFRITGSRKK